MSGEVVFNIFNVFGVTEAAVGARLAQFFGLSSLAKRPIRGWQKEVRKVNWGTPS